MRMISLLLFSIAVVSCASSFKPSHHFLSLKGKITRDHAMATFQDVGKNVNTGEMAGICRVGSFYGADENMHLQVSATYFSYRAYTKGKYVGEKEGVQFFEKKYFTKIIPFSDISVLRVLPYKTSKCKMIKSGSFDYIIVLHQNPFTEILSIAVNKSSLDSYLVALSTLSDNPRIVQGAGL